MTLQLNKDKLLAASAPVIWGSSYIVTTELLPDLSPLTVAALRALPAGLLMLAITRNLPTRDWWGKLLVLGALNFSIFWAALFVAAYRLPGGVAATLGAVQPLFVLFLASVLLGTSLTARGVAAAVTGMLGVALLVLGPNAGLDATGTLAALIGAGSMATGVVLTRLWQPPVSALTFTAWQLTAGGLLLLPVAVWVDPPLPSLTLSHLTGLVWLSVIGAALTYVFWFRAIERLGPAAITSLGFLSPLSAVLLGWILLGQTLSAWQILGAGIVLVSVWAGQKSRKPKRA
ncbi:EamA family transporter [Aliiroseovarius lamellibrachiae]|uniref:EamA family transporter n=1 Tax=Aliiroseovarius lamellibrachiae TaxID=1924933 RepID=UPI001BE038D9|nr:EamA family transporter [Aliiroseovarius lamellibrachiae]MBT2131430.1 EamA family transporter [Aliiroseovarius lamellibrachiae]